MKLRQGNTAFRDKRIYKSKRSAKRENRAVSVIPAEGNQEAATELLADGAKTEITDWGHESQFNLPQSATARPNIDTPLCDIT